MELQAVDVPGLRRLQALYRRSWPQFCQEYHVLRTAIEFVKVGVDAKHLKIFQLEDAQAQEQGLFLIVDHHQLFMGCLGDSLDLLAQALHQLDWSRGLMCSTVPKRYLETLRLVVEQKQLLIEYFHLSDLYHLPAKQALQLPLDCPKGFYLRSLAVQDAFLINQEWPFSRDGSLHFLQRQIRLCPSVGLYDEHSHELVAWCIRSQDGLLSALQVLQTHKRRGLGSVVVTALAQRIAESGDDVTAEVYAENTPSVGLFRKLGFQVINQCHWLNTAPAQGRPNFSWSAGE